MAQNPYVNKVVFGSVSIIDISDTTATASDVAQGKYFYAATGEKLEGTATGGGTGAVSVVDTQDAAGGTIRTITALDISDTTAVASDVASGKYFYTADGTKTAGTGSGGSPNLQAKTGITPTTGSQTITPDQGYDGLSSVQINAMPSGTAGIPTASKSAVSNHSVTVTPSVTNTAGYISGGTKTGTAVTVSASELVSGTQTITANGTVDVTTLASVIVSVSGGTGLEYESGTWTPEADVTGEWIYFTNTHTSEPIAVILCDSTGEYDATENTMYTLVIANYYGLTGEPLYVSTTSFRYANVFYSNRGTNATAISNSTTSITSLGNSTNTSLGYWLTSTGFYAYGMSSSRYWRASHSYKWIAVWKPAA